ncbi:flagellin [Methylobacterium tarhaniae]|uniref:flagellin N-terminal helical domain-containing protein n=1 Tax=Methylobacterium tarhaniae TaxID=1187852 RepID=UPI003D04D72F
MSSSITLSAATRQNLLSLQDTASLLSTTQTRLSTGKKVNSALDSPINFFTAQNLSSRAGDIGNLLDGLSNGVQAIQAANQGITSIQKLVDSAKSAANQALADKGATTSGLPATVATVSGTKSFQGLAGTADGTQDFSTVAKDGSVDISLDGGKTKTTIRLDAATLSNNGADATKVSASQLVSAINSQISNTTALKGKVTASVGNDGRISFATTNSGATQQLSVQGSASSTLDIGFGKATSPTAAKFVAAAAFGTPAFTAANGSFLNVSDGNVTASLAVTSTTLKSDGTAVGATPSADDVVDAYNVQLKAAGSTITAFNNGGTLEFRATDVGPTSTVSVVVASPGAGTQVSVGFGATTGAANGATTVGTGTAATGLSSVGSDATDGSAKAIINGTVAIADATGGPPATAGGIDLSGTRNASFTIQLGSGQAKTITVGAAQIVAAGGAAAFASRDNIAAAINTQIAADTGLAGNVTASFDANNKLVLNSTKVGSTQQITVTAAQGTTVANNVNIGLGTQTSTVNGTATNTAVALTSTGKDSTSSTNSTRQTLAKQFNELLNQITQQAKDTSYNGINLIYRNTNDPKENTLHITFNETGSSSIDVAGADLDADGLGLTKVTGGFQSDDEINAALSSISTATTQLRAQSSTFGANLTVVQNRQDFSKNLINILGTGAANLTSADLNEEAANSQALSTRNSLAISALSLANQAQQGILQLLR